MGQVVGYLPEDRATHGEKLVLKKLKTALPTDFYVYVECPLHGRRVQRFPDFIILANFGVVVLEVKDWVQVIEVDKYAALIRDRQGQTRRARNPVLVAREYATMLADELQTVPDLLKDNRKLSVPWGYAAVFPNLPTTVLTQLRRVWGEEYVLGAGDLEHPWATQRLRATLPLKNVALHSWEMHCIRGVINPSILITPEDSTRAAVILDSHEEIIITEEPHAPAAAEGPQPAANLQDTLFSTAKVAEISPPPPPPAASARIAEDIAINAAIRLVRGVAGSGKTLVLTRRAKYLSAQHPEWRMCVLTYNDPLARALRAQLKGCSRVKVVTFHALCSSLLRAFRPWREPHDPKGWIRYHIDRWPVARALGVDFLCDEIRWIKEVGIRTRAEYLVSERRGRGARLSASWREQAYDLLEAYEAWLAKEDALDWSDVPYLVLQALDQGQLEPPLFDAILIDEAQDFAPVWFQVIKRLLKPDEGVLFMADDPSQSIYRFYSWREKGIPVVGRTRWLRIPYRNTREIYQAAYEVIREDEILKRQLEDQIGTAILEPDLTSAYLRTGARPELRRFSSFKAELNFIRLQIEALLQSRLSSKSIAVLHRRRPGVRKLQEHLRGLDVEVATFHALKGLEYEAIFLSQMQETFAFEQEPTQEQLSEERRLVYMAMTRARERLYLNYEAHWPQPLKAILPYIDEVPTD